MEIIYCIIILPSLIIIVLEIIRIVNVLTAEKKKKLESDREELELLRQKLKALESGEAGVVEATAPSVASENINQESDNQ